jgi:hypothetical protein
MALSKPPSFERKKVLLCPENGVNDNNEVKLRLFTGDGPLEFD